MKDVGSIRSSAPSTSMLDAPSCQSYGESVLDDWEMALAASPPLSEERARCEGSEGTGGTGDWVNGEHLSRSDTKDGLMLYILLPSSLRPEDRVVKEPDSDCTGLSGVKRGGCGN